MKEDLKGNKNIYITTPIFYVNDKPHIGHAYTDIATDCIARLYALNGSSVRCQTGTDEHGQKVEKSAEKNNVNTMQFCNSLSEKFYKLAIDMNCISSYPVFDVIENFNRQKLSKELYIEAKKKSEKSIFEILESLKGISESSNSEELDLSSKFTPTSLFNNGKNFIRTTEGRSIRDGSITKDSIKNGRHVNAVQYFWNRLMNNGWIYKGLYSGWYSVRDEAFYTEEELVDGKAPTGADVIWHSDEVYFFKLSKFQKILLDIYRGESIIYPYEKFTEIVSFLSGIDFASGIKGKFKEGYLHDLCISRTDLHWGIPVPEDKKSSIYVWIDALVNYLSAINYPSQDSREYWKDSKVIHIIGKDIIRFHCVYWPALLIAENCTVEEFDKDSDNPIFLRKCLDFIPNNFFAHGWWMNKGEKISKSLGNVIDPNEEVEAIMQNYGIDSNFATDYFRFSLIQAIPFGNDGNYDRELTWHSIDSILCGSIGNLINRVFHMIGKNCDLEQFFSRVNKMSKEEVDFFNNVNKNMHFGVKCLFEDYTSLVQEYKIQEIIRLAFQISDRCNSYIELTSPWKVAKEDKERLQSILQILYVLIIEIMQLLYFLLPNFVDRFFNHINLNYDLRRFPTKENSGDELSFKELPTEDRLLNLIKLYRAKGKNGSSDNCFKDMPIFFQKSIS